MSQETSIQKKPWLNSSGINFLVNMLSFFSVAVLTVTGLFVLKRLGRGETLLGFPKRSWEELHERIGIVMAALVVYHLIRHRKWIASAFSGQILGEPAYRKRTWISVAIATLLLALFGFAGLFER